MTLSNEPEAGSFATVIRRRRPTWRHRRNRLIRRAVWGLFFVTLTAALTSVALRELTPSLFRAAQHGEIDRQAAEASRDLFLAVQQESLRQMEDRPVYPYSIVPGGVRNAKELKAAAEHDPVVARHFAGFDYDHARVVRLALARTVYVSYRIGNKVYWSRHRIGLKKGETVITDGKITARTRCANRVEEIPQQLVSQTEPSVAQFEEPMAPAAGSAVANPPVPFQSALLNRAPVQGLGTSQPLSSYDPITGGNMVPFSPAPLPLPGVCGIGGKGKGSGSEGGTATGTKGKKKGTNPCGHGGEVPEPGSWLLVATGLGLMIWKMRQKFGWAVSP
jgi:hypothetical protein